LRAIFQALSPRILSNNNKDLRKRWLFANSPQNLFWNKRLQRSKSNHRKLIKGFCLRLQV